MKIFTSTPFVNDSAGGVPKVVIPLVDCLSERLFEDSQLLYHSGIHKKFKNHNIVKFVSRYKPDIMHDHGAWLPFHLKIYLVSKVLHIPFVLSPHGTLETWAMNHKFMKKRIAWYIYQKRILRNANVIVVNSDQEFKRIRELGFENPIAVIDNGVEIPLCFERRMGSRHISRKALFLSRINAKKGIIELLHSWKESRVYDEYGYILDIYGNSDDSKYLSKVKSTIDELNLKESVFLKGPVYGEEKWIIYDQHDFFILPSHSENFGIVIPEALFSGIPVITTINTPWQHLNTLGFGKSVSLSGDDLKNAIQDYVKLMVKQKYISSDFRSSARAYVLDNYTWPNITLKYIHLYRWILGKENKPDFVHLK